MYATVLWFLLFLFCLRVAGQALVAAFAVPFLPPMQQWYSGVLPYPILLPVQILIIVLLAKVATDFTRRRGFFVVPRRTMGRLLQWSCAARDRKSTRLNSSHRCISYAVFCLKKKNKQITPMARM